jgi:hypothetical protein
MLNRLRRHRRDIQEHPRTMFLESPLRNPQNTLQAQLGAAIAVFMIASDHATGVTGAAS